MNLMGKKEKTASQGIRIIFKGKIGKKSWKNY